ncbi:MAG TPA: extensin family protein [Polyangiaceae bacterium]|nr:extensin family protein [Polyangiaceae bacterium]
MIAFASVLSSSAEVLPHQADEDADNDGVVGPPDVVDDCAGKLRAAGIDFTEASLPVRANRRGLVCGAEQVVIYRRGPTGIRWNASPLVTCRMALGLAELERVVQGEAEKMGQRVVRIEQGGTYNCRKMARYDWVSEHSYANAIDVRAFTLRNGKRIGVLEHFGKLDAEPTTPEGRFLRAVAHRLYDEGAFSVVLTRYFDELHRDHFHLDMARYRVDGTRPDSR